MLISERKVRYETQPRLADWPAKSAIVTGPERCRHDTSPISILPSIFRLKIEMSQVLAMARVKLVSGQYCTHTRRLSADASGCCGPAPNRPMRAGPALAA